MRKIRRCSFIVVLFAVFFISSLGAHADLYNRGTDINGNRLIYDSGLNITWYDYTNNIDTWQNQLAWADTLEVTQSGNTYSDWRLPTTVDGPRVLGYNGTTTAGYNITSSEMGHLFYTELGNKGYYATDGTNPQPGWGLTNTGDFQHLTTEDSYWSGTENKYSSFLRAWVFDFSGGNQWTYVADNVVPTYTYALAVRSGDVAQQPIAPEPISSVLFITGGTLLAWRRLLKRGRL